MNRLILILLSIMFLDGMGFAQPGVSWMQMYDVMAGRQYFKDIYAVSDGGYMMCGATRDRFDNEYRTQEMWLVRIDEDGNVIWSGFYGIPGIPDCANTIVETEEGNFISGGYGDGFQVLMVDAEGEQIWLNGYGGGHCEAIIELKSGEFLLAGSRDGSGYLLCINSEGERLWDRTYLDSDATHFYAMRETEGGVIVAGPSWLENQTPRIRFWVVKIDIDNEGDIIWARHHFREGGGHQQLCYSMVSMPEGGFALAGYTIINDDQGNIDIDFLLIAIDDDGNMDWSEQYDLAREGFRDYGKCIARLDNDDLVLVGWEDRDPRTIVQSPAALRIRPNGIERWHATYNFPDQQIYGPYLNQFNSVILGHDNSIVAAGTVNFYGENIDEYEGQNGLVMKLEYEDLTPQFIFYSPEDTVLTVLRGDSIQFIARAIYPQGGELDYLWTMGEDILPGDTTTTVTFEELGEFNVRCRVSDGESDLSITWYISVMELYISEFNPDSLEMYVRRGHEVDFSVTPRAIEGDPVNYLWTMTDLNTRRDSLLGETDSITVQFAKAHDFRVEGIAYRNQTEDAVQWLVHCCSTIWEWWPQELELSLPVDDAADFGIWPFNPDSDSITVEWSLDGEMISDNWEIHVVLEETGDHEIEVVVNDGCESDTLAWLVNVYDPDGIAGQTGMPILPEVLTLYPVYPNPFNAETSVRFYLPEAGNVRLQLHDLSGREVIPLVSGMCSSGFNVIHLNGTELPAGLYLMSLTSLDDTRRQKIVVVK